MASFTTPDTAAIPVASTMMTEDDIEYVDYLDESMLPEIHRLVSKDLSEPYSIFTYRYFLHNWPKMCLCVYSKDAKTQQRGAMIATLVCKAEVENEMMQGYIAMLAVDQAYRNRGIGSRLVLKGIQRMIEVGCKEIVLETEVSLVFSPMISCVCSGLY